MLRQTRNRKENILNNCHIVGDAKKEGKVGGSEEVRQDGKSSCQRKDLSEREKPIKINFQDAKRNLKLKTRSQSKYYQPKPHFGRLNYIKCVILVTLRFFFAIFRVLLCCRVLCGFGARHETIYMLRVLSFLFFFVAFSACRRALKTSIAVTWSVLIYVCEKNSEINYSRQRRRRLLETTRIVTDTGTKLIASHYANRESHFLELVWRRIESCLFTKRPQLDEVGRHILISNIAENANEVVNKFAQMCSGLNCQRSSFVYLAFRRSCNNCFYCVVANPDWIESEFADGEEEKCVYDASMSFTFAPWGQHVCSHYLCYVTLFT